LAIPGADDELALEHWGKSGQFSRSTRALRCACPAQRPRAAPMQQTPELVRPRPAV